VSEDKEFGKWVRASLDCETTGLNPVENHVVAIGVLKTDAQGQQKGKVFTVKDRVTDPETGFDKPSISEQLRIITEFADFLSNPARNANLYGYNSDCYDFPFLASKSMMKDDYGDLVDTIRELWQNHGVDLMKKHGMKTNGYPMSLDDLLQKNGFTHEGEISGKDIPEYYQDGKVDEIKEYLKEDVRKTDKLVQNLEY